MKLLFCAFTFMWIVVVMTSCQMKENAANSKFFDEGSCPIEYGYLDGLFKLKNPEDGKIAEIALEVQRAGTQISGARTAHTLTDKMAEVSVVDADMIELQTSQQELEKLTAEIGLSASTGEKLRTELLASVGQSMTDLIGNEFDAHYNAAEEAAMGRLQNNLMRDLIQGAANITASAKASGEELEKIATRVGNSGDAIDSGLRKLYDAIGSITADTAEMANAKIALHNALAQMNIERHGLPNRTVVGQYENGEWIEIQLKQPKDGSHDEWDIWGVTITKKDGSVFRFNPLITTDGGERLVLRDSLRDKYFGDRVTCESDSGSGSGSGSNGN